MGEKPFNYRDSLPNKLDDKDILDQIRFQVSRNNVKEPRYRSKKKVFNPFSLLLADPTLGPHMWMKRAKYNKKIMVTGHRDHKATQCCGDPMYEWITSDSPRWKKPKRKASKWSIKSKADLRKKFKIIYL